jgi:pepF/M3 family oligoendopeptidase
MTTLTPEREDLKAPAWDLGNVYPGPDSPEVRADLARARELLAGLRESTAGLADDPDPRALARLMEAYNTAADLVSTLRAYANCLVTADSSDQAAARLEGTVTVLTADFSSALVRLPILLGRLDAGRLEEILSAPELADARFILGEMAEQGRHLMSQPEEELALELGKNGVQAWRRLYRRATSRLSFDLELAGGEVRRVPVSAVNGYLQDPDRGVRERAWKGWRKAHLDAADLLAATFNSITGTNLSLARRRGEDAPLAGSLRASRLTLRTVEAMWAATRARLPRLRGFLRAKSRALGLTRMASWDAGAPIPGVPARKTPYPETVDVIAAAFAEFSPGLADLARMMVDRLWIDAEQRDGKAPGGYCTSLPTVKEPRIFMNYGGGSSASRTLAHELGHAWHYWLIKDLPMTRRQYTMPLAETASTLAETVVVKRAIQRATGAERLELLAERAGFVFGIVPMIMARYDFEGEVYRRRGDGELAAEELATLSREAFAPVVGDDLDPDSIEDHFWAHKLHHYHYPFYNYPYSFGALLSLGLHGLYEQRGAEFVPEIEKFLVGSGSMGTEPLARSVGIDLEAPEFWELALDQAVEEVARFEAGVAG